MTIGRRRRPDDRPRVEFVGAEESPVPAADFAPPARNQRWYLLLSAVVLAAVAVAVGHATKDDKKAAPSTTATRNPAATSTPHTQPSTDPTHCPGKTSCAVTTLVPAATAAAIMHEFPDATVGPTATVQFPSLRIWFRQLSARVGPLNLVVRIQLQRADPATLGPSRTNTLETYVRADEHGYVVQIDADGPVPGVPDLRKLYRLAADPRLYAVG